MVWTDYNVIIYDIGIGIIVYNIYFITYIIYLNKKKNVLIIYEYSNLKKIYLHKIQFQFSKV